MSIVVKKSSLKYYIIIVEKFVEWLGKTLSGLGMSLERIITSYFLSSLSIYTMQQFRVVVSLKPCCHHVNCIQYQYLLSVQCYYHG